MLDGLGRFPIPRWFRVGATASGAGPAGNRSSFLGLLRATLLPIDGQVHAAFRSALSGPELRSEGEDRLAPPFVLRSDVHDERRSHVGVGNRIKNLEGAVGFSFDGQLLQASKEAAFVAQG